MLGLEARPWWEVGVSEGLNGHILPWVFVSSPEGRFLSLGFRGRIASQVFFAWPHLTGSTPEGDLRWGCAGGSLGAAWCSGLSGG